MTQKETTNTIIKLLEKGWSYQEVIEFLGFIETHNPSEEEFNNAVKAASSNDGLVFE